MKKYIKSNNIFELLEDCIKEELDTICTKQSKKIDNVELLNVFNQKYVNNTNFATFDKNIISDKKILCISKNENDYELIKFILNQNFSKDTLISYNNKIDDNIDFDIILLDSDICCKNNEIEKLKNFNHKNIIILGNIIPNLVNLGIPYFITRPIDIEKIVYNISNIISKAC